MRRVPRCLLDKLPSMPLCPTLRFSFPDWGEGPSFSALQVVSNPDMASSQGLDIVGDHLEGSIDSPYRKRA